MIVEKRDRTEGTVVTDTVNPSRKDPLDKSNLRQQTTFLGSRTRGPNLRGNTLRCLIGLITSPVLTTFKWNFRP